MMDGHQFGAEYILESGESLYYLKVFKRVIYTITGFFAAPMFVGEGFGWDEGPIGVITILGLVLEG